MKSKNTIRLTILGLIITGCFMIAQQASAQSWGSKSGTIHDTWVVNDDDSNHWARLRLQTSTNKAWNIYSGNGGLKWTYDTSSSHSNTGTQRMVLTTGGNLGVGTASPTGRLHVYGSDNDGTNAALHVASSGQLMLLDGNEIDVKNGTLYINANVVHDVTVAAGGGNVGIGTNAPETRLHIEGGADAGLISDGFLMLGTSGASNIIFDDNEIMARNNGAISTLYAQADGGEFRIHNTSEAEIFVVKDDGSVGIGTSSPASRFHINQLINDANGAIKIVNSSQGQQFNLFVDGSNNSRIESGSEGQGTLILNSGSGKVGIGIASPSEKLEVAGTVKATSFVSSAASFPDYVFAENYKIMPLQELETYVTQHKRLPNMPAEKEVVKQGLNVPDVVIKSVENIETIYLHLIRMEKEIKALQQENAALKKQLQQGR